MKHSGKRRAGNPHAPFDVAGTGDGPSGTAPVPDPTCEGWGCNAPAYSPVCGDLARVRLRGVCDRRLRAPDRRLARVGSLRTDHINCPPRIPVRFNVSCVRTVSTCGTRRKQRATSTPAYNTGRRSYRPIRQPEEGLLLREHWRKIPFSHRPGSSTGARRHRAALVSKPTRR